MPYRRLPNTDKSRLQALKTLLDNNDIYTVKDRFLNWKDINEARTVYDRLLTIVTQYDIDKKAQARGKGNCDRLKKKAMLYVSHFINVLRMCVERGEIKRSMLSLYGLPDKVSALPKVQTLDALSEWADKIIAGEKQRIKQGGRPIYNPSIGMVTTHYDIFKETYTRQKLMQNRTRNNELQLKEMRPEIDQLILRIWDQVEARYKNESWDDRIRHCAQFGIKYYLRKRDKQLKDD